MFCENCGTQCADNLSACPNCGAGLKNPYQSHPAPAPGPVNAPAMIPPEYSPITMWGYFGYKWLFAIPLVGFILLIIFAVSANNRNLKNFARSYFCDLIIGCVIFGIILAIVLATGSLVLFTKPASEYFNTISDFL
ncbi:MAG: hypothetical protein K5985_04945 [Lachnospiraceae bacterium]|nr:hypothetical protein [Lachnospiraceae bacterium]